MELTSQELSYYYSLFENWSNQQIETYIAICCKINDNAIDASKDPILSLKEYLRKKIGSIFKSDQTSSRQQSKEDVSINTQSTDWFSSLPEICKEYALRYSDEIKIILQNNPQKTNFVISIIQLLAPVIAQEYSGIPAMAIVGAITILCRQGIENFIK